MIDLVPSRTSCYGCRNRGESSGNLTSSGVQVMQPLAKQNLRRSKNAAVALALLAFVVVLYFVTIVKFGQQLQQSETEAAPGARTALSGEIRL